MLIPSNRLAAVAANAFASLNKLAPGRIDFGVGTGFTGRRAMGLGAVRLADMEEYIRVVQALLAGETVEAEIEGKRRLIRLLNPELGLINTKDPIGLYVAATGPRAQALTARLGAGWISTIGDPAGGGRGTARDAAAARSRRARRRRVRLGGADRRRDPGGGGARRQPARHRASRPARRDAAAPRRRPGVGRFPQYDAGPAVGRRDRRPLYRVGPPISGRRVPTTSKTTAAI